MAAPPQDSGADRGGNSSDEAQRWESRLLAIDALIELARQQALDEPGSCSESDRLGRAIGALRDACDARQSADIHRIEAAVRDFAEIVAGPEDLQEQRT